MKHQIFIVNYNGSIYILLAINIHLSLCLNRYIDKLIVIGII